jgi:hypothetical protein
VQVQQRNGQLQKQHKFTNIAQIKKLKGTEYKNKSNKKAK